MSNLRQTGRTTNMLLQGLNAAISHPFHVFYVFHSLAMAEHGKQMFMPHFEKTVLLKTSTIRKDRIVAPNGSCFVFVSKRSFDRQEFGLVDTMVLYDHVVKGEL